jgi:hypothetical protein
MAEDSSDRILVIPWTPPAPCRRREIIQGEGRRSAAVRPIRAEARALLIDALRDAYCWQDELIRGSSRTIDSIAAREKKTERSIRMALSLAFLSPALVKAAIEGRLSRGFGVKRLMDLPMSWSDPGPCLVSRRPRRLDRNLIGSTHHPQHTSLIPRLATRSGLRRSLPRKACQPGFGKRNFAARDSPPRPAARGGQTRQMAVADRARPC